MKPFPKLLVSLTRPLTLLLLLISLLGSVSPAYAATFTVTKTADTNDGTCNSDCSLREAISAANASPGADTITLLAGTYQLSIANASGINEDANATGDLDVLDSLTIQGAGSATTIIEAGTNTSDGIDKVFALNPICTSAINVTIDGVTVQFGRNTQPSGAADFSFTGGGIDWCSAGSGGTFTLSNSVVTNNTNVNGYGGGLNVDTASSPTTVNITNDTFSNNQTLSTTQTATGGAINLFGNSPTVNITNSTFTSNHTTNPTSGGGAIYFRPTTVGHLSITGSTFTTNTAPGIGGAIATDSHGAGTTVSISSSTFTGNTATNSFGGALKLDGTNLNTTPFSLTHLTITGNTAGISGGGIFVGNSNVTMSKSLIVGNNAPTGKGIHKSVDAATATVTNNWWGCSTGPGAAPCDTATTAGGTLTFTPWYRDQLTASTSPIVTNQSTSLTASLLTNSANSAVPLADISEIIGRGVTWAGTHGNLSGTQSTVQTAGTATGSFQATSVGTAIISAKVDNDNTSPVSSNVLSLTVNKADTTAAITSDTPDPSVTGQPVAVNFSVTGAFGNSPTAPTGNVTVSDGTDNCTGSVATGTCNLTFRTAGAKTITATYAGDANFNASPASASVSHTVNKADTTTTITSHNPDPSVTGQTVTFNVTVAAVAPGAAVSTTTITGTVLVSDGGTNTCTATLAAGAGSCTIAFPSVGSYSLTGTYGGDANFNGSTSAANSHTVNKADTTTAITSDNPDPSDVGQAVTVNFTVTANAPGAGTPTGNVTVSDGVDSCTGTVTSGTCNITLTTPGARTLTASYAGDSNFNSSTSAGESHSVNKINTTTTITSDNPDPSVVGQAVTVQFNVTPSSGSLTPTGNVTVSDGTASCTGTVAAGQCSLTFTSAGAKSLTATYAGDGNFNGSASATESHQVNKADTTTTITSDNPDSSVVGQSVTVKYSVAVNAPGAGTPTGNVTVSDGTTSCTGTVAAGQCNITFTSTGAKSLTATYAGNSNFNGSSSAAESHQVDKADTTTTITSDNPDPSDAGQAVTVNFTVIAIAPGSGTPTGNVTVSDGVDSCTGTIAAGTCSITLTTSGARTLTATYAGDSNFNGSTSAGEPHTVNGIATTTAITSDNPDPSVVGQSVTVQYSVTPSVGSGTPTGNVTVSDGTTLCTGTVAAGQCSLTFTSAGAKSLTATYAGDSNFTGSSSVIEAHTVNAADTTTSITSDNPDPSVVGQAVTVQFSVLPNAPGAGTPTGNVTVSDGTVSCTATVAAGQCSLTFTSVGAKSLTATYAGDSNFNGSTSATTAHTVNAANTTTTITSDNPDPSTVGQAVTVQYSVTVTSPGAGTPTGNVTVSDGTVSCTGTVAAGQCLLTFTSAGAKSLTATYAGDSNFNSSTSAAEPHSVNGTPTTTTITSDNPDPSVVGQTVTVQYSVTSGSGTPTGNVTVSDGTVSCIGTVAAGQCSLTFTSAGAKSLTATYAGDSTFSGSTSAAEAHQVNKADTTTTITSDNPDPSTQGSAVTVKYSVTINSPGAGTPTGNVTVSDGVNSCTGTVAAGQCNITLTTLGSRTLTMTYAGDSNFNGSTSAGEPHTVNPPNTAPTATVTNGICSPINIAGGIINLTLFDADHDPLTLKLASNSNTSLIPNKNIGIELHGYQAAIGVLAQPKKSGTAILTFNLSDGTQITPITITVKVGTDSNETLNGTAGIDIIFGLNGKNTINGGDGNDLLCGGNGVDTINGGNGNDILDGENGNDILNGGNDKDILRGSLGNDTLTGGTGADFFSGGPGTDVATDFNAGQGDTQDGTIP